MKGINIIVIIMISVAALGVLTALVSYSVFDNDFGGVACTLEAKICPDGSSVGRDPANNCIFSPCPGDPERHYCERDAEDGLMVGCDANYAPVCGFFDGTKIQCIRSPCADTFGNGCSACLNENVLFYEKGTCEALYPVECSEEECGPRPLVPSFLCYDQITVAGVGGCVRNEQNKCSWEIVVCP